MKKVEPKFRKVTMNIPTKIYEQLSQRCKENGTSTTAEILSLVRFALRQEEAIEMLPTVINALNVQKPIKNLKK